MKNNQGQHSWRSPDRYVNTKGPARKYKGARPALAPGAQPATQGKRDLPVLKSKDGL